MDFNDHQPIYIQIMDLIKFRIIRGELKPGDKLPAVREIAGDLKVNPNTVQRSYSDLEREGILLSQRGVGSFVVENKELFDNLRKEMAREIVYSFIEDMKKLGMPREKSITLIEESWVNDD